MQHSLVFYLIMILGFFNGLVVSLFIFFKTNSSSFLKLAALGVFLFSLSILRELLYVFGDDIELDLFISRFFYFKLLTVGLIILAYDRASSSENVNPVFLLLPGILEFLLLNSISMGWVFWENVVSDSMFIATDCISFFWLLYEYNRRRKQKKQRENLKFLSFFAFGFMLIFLTRVIQLLAILIGSEGLYDFHFLFRIIAIGIVVYLISIYLIISYSNYNKRKGRNASLIKPKNKQLLKLIKEDQKYLDQNTTLEKLASYYDIDSKTLSATIREHENSSFKDFLNSLRLEYFMLLIEDSEHKKFTIMALAEKSGFNSKATFNRVFKKSYGISPSSYISQRD